MARKLRYNDEEGGMVKAQLQKIETYAAKLNEMIHPDDELEGWVQAKLAVVAAYMGDVKHYLDYELKQSFGEGGVPAFKNRHWEVEFTWEGADEEGRKVNIMADTIAEAERKVKEKFGPYYKGIRIVEIEEDKEVSWDEYAENVKKKMEGKKTEGARIDGGKPVSMADGGVAGSKYQIAQKHWKEIEESMTPKQKSIYNQEYKRLESKFDQFDDREIAEYIQGGINEFYDTSFKLTTYEINGKNWFKLGFKYIALNEAINNPEWYEDMAKGGVTSDEAYKRRMKKWGFQPYGKTKGKFKVKYEADGEPQTEIWETKEMAIAAAKKYAKMDEFTNPEVFDESGKKIMAEGGETLPAEKVYIEITKPTELKSKSVAKKIKEFADMGYRSGQILLKMAFVGTDKLTKELTDGFQVLKNNIFLINKMDQHLKEKGIEPKKYYRGGRMSDLYVKYEGSSFSEDMKEAKEYLGEEMWNSFTRDERIEATKYLKAQGLVGFSGEMEDLETVAAMQYKKGGSVPEKTTVDFIKALEESKIIAKDAHKNPKAIETIRGIISMSNKDFKEYIKANPNRNVKMIFEEYSDWIETYKE